MNVLLKGLITKLTVFSVLATASVGVFAQSDPTKPVATVNGETISGIEYFRRMEFLPGVGRMVGNRFVESYPGYLALRQMIEERLLLQLAAEKKVLPKDADVKAQLDLKLKEDPQLLENLAKVGISKADIEYQIRLDLAEFNIVTNGITVTDQEIEQHYRDNPSRFTIPKRYKLRLIAVTEGKKQEVDDQLAAGKNFADVAKALSQDSSASTGGELGEIPDTAFSELVRANLERTKIGQATAWVQGTSGWFKFLIEDIKPAEKIPLDDNLRKQLRKSLMMDRGRVRNNIEVMMADMRHKAKVTITQPGLDPIIQKWLQDVLPD